MVDDSLFHLMGKRYLPLMNKSGKELRIMKNLKSIEVVFVAEGIEAVRGGGDDGLSPR